MQYDNHTNKMANSMLSCSMSYGRVCVSLSQATEYLAQGLSLSLAKNLSAVAAAAAFDSTECCGVFDPISAKIRNLFLPF